jgi:hypothetical protein
MRALEVVHVNSLREFFCRKPGSRHDVSLLF